MTRKSSDDDRKEPSSLNPNHNPEPKRKPQNFLNIKIGRVCDGPKVFERFNHLVSLALRGVIDRRL